MIFDELRAEYVVHGGRNDATGQLTADTTLIGYHPNAPGEACTAATLDYDRDGLAGARILTAALAARRYARPAQTCMSDC